MDEQERETGDVGGRYDIGVVYRGVKGRRPRRARVTQGGTTFHEDIEEPCYIIELWTGRGRVRQFVIDGGSPARRMLDKWLGDGARAVRP